VVSIAVSVDVFGFKIHPELVYGYLCEVIFVYELIGGRAVMAQLVRV